MYSNNYRVQEVGESSQLPSLRACHIGSVVIREIQFGKTEDLPPVLLTYDIIQQQGLPNELSDETIALRRAVCLGKTEHLQTGLHAIHRQAFLSHFQTQFFQYLRLCQFKTSHKFPLFAVFIKGSKVLENVHRSLSCSLADFLSKAGMKDI